jgi:hypothetical protein
MLPILTFDEHQLTPAYGYVFNATWIDPYESIVVFSAGRRSNIRVISRGCRAIRICGALQRL